MALQQSILRYDAVSGKEDLYCRLKESYRDLQGTCIPSFC